MRENKTKTKLHNGQTVFGVIGANSDPMLAELIGLAGFDFYMLDAEHGPIAPAQAANIVRACEAVDITPLARIGQNDPKLILQYLDAGIMGIMMPNLYTVAQIEGLVQAIKYPPLGRRGLGLTRPANYMMDGASQADYIDFANRQTLVLPQFEDPALLEYLPQMAAVTGVDGFVFGPRDLSLTMGFPDGPNHPEVQTVIDQAIAIMRSAGLIVGITAGTAESAQAQIERGAQLILNSVPNVIKQGSEVFLKGHKRQF